MLHSRTFQHQNNASTGSNDPRSFSTRDFGYSLYSVSQTEASRPGTSDIHFTQSPRPKLLDQVLRIFTLLSLPDRSFSTRDFGYSLYSVSQTEASRPGTSDIHFTQSPRPKLLDQGLRIFTLLSLPDRSFSTRDFGYSLYSVSQTEASRPGTSDIHFTQSPRPQLLDQGLRIFTLLSLPDQ